MERYAEQGVVIGTVRYVWKELAVQARVAITEMSWAEALRMISCCPRLGELSGQVQNRLVDATDRHPYTIKILDDMIGNDLKIRGQAYQVQDAWEELVIPHLPYGQLKAEKHLLLGGLWKLLSREEQQHMKRLTFLQAPAPPAVLDALGSSTNRLIELGLLMRVPERVRVQSGWVWEDRWSLHSVVARFAQKRLEGGEEIEAHALAGEEYAKLLESNNARSTDVLQAIHHLHRASKGDRAWTWAEGVAIARRDMAQYKQVQELLEESMAAGVKGDSRARALMLLAQVRVRTGKYDDIVESILDEAWAASEKDEIRASVLHTKGDFKEKQGKYKEAEELLRESLAIKEKALRSTHPEYGASLHALAWVLERQGKYKEAEKLLQESLAIKEKALGSSHPEYGVSLHALALVLERQGKYEEAERLLQESLAIYEKALGRTHPSYGASLHALAGVLERQGKYEEAEKLLWESLAIDEKALGSTHPNLCPTLVNLGAVLAEQLRWQDGEVLVQRAVDIANEKLGLSHPETAQMLTVLAQLQVVLKKPEAATTASRALEALLMSLGPAHPTTKEVAPFLLFIANGGAP
jgi:tetratricopeptide (TPR) repeat protein